MGSYRCRKFFAIFVFRRQANQQNPMKLKLILLTILSFFSLTTFAQSGFPFDNEIRDFKHQDSLHFPKPNGILFIGSSSIRKWTDLEQRFADKPIIRRGVGGCQLSQLEKFQNPLDDDQEETAKREDLLYVAKVFACTCPVSRGSREG